LFLCYLQIHPPIGIYYLKGIHGMEYQVHEKKGTCTGPVRSLPHNILPIP